MPRHHTQMPDIHCKWSADRAKRTASSDRGNEARGRFAPSPSGRMHLGNVFTALVSWLSVRKQGGKWILRIEDLDTQRSKAEYARQIEDDLLWLGLEWDEGGIDGHGHYWPYVQSQRGEIYEAELKKLNEAALTYPCYCRRADIMATQAPHQSDGRVVYAGTCRPDRQTIEACGGPPVAPSHTGPGATRLMVPDRDITFTDKVYGRQTANLAAYCGDFVVRRADGQWAYQLAVVADDALMGITEVVRGSDLLLSTAQQLYLYSLLGYEAPSFAHIPLLCNVAGLRLAKRDEAMNLGELRKRFSPREIIGRLALVTGLIDTYSPLTPAELIDAFDWGKIAPQLAINISDRIFATP